MFSYPRKNNPGPWEAYNVVADPNETNDLAKKNPELVEVPDSHRRVLDERLAELESNPDTGESWDIVKAGILERLRRT